MKRTGRPPLNPDEGPSVPVHLKLAPSEYDAAYARARLGRVSVPEQIRREMRAAVAAAASKRNPK